MGAELAVEPKPHDIASQKVNAWRGSCLDLFARGEQTIGSALEFMCELPSAQVAVKLRHLAGQRSNDLARHISAYDLTAKQQKGITNALALWRAHEDRRCYLAHATSAVTLDRRGDWFAIFDLTVYRAGAPQAQRWAISQSEADCFLSEMRKNLQKLGGLLGQLRKVQSDG